MSKCALLICEAGIFDGPLVSESEFVTADPGRARAVAYGRHVTAKIKRVWLSFRRFVEVNASAIEQAADGVEMKNRR